MSNEYHLADGSPRYGHRTAAASEQASHTSARVEATAESAALLSLDEMSAAIDRRLGSAWADAQNPALTALREENPEELAAARALVKLHLGSQHQWRLKAQAVRDKRMAATVRRRKASGSARKIFLLRLGLIVSLIAPPAYVVTVDQTDLVRLLVTGAICLIAAFVGGHYLTVWARVPVMPNIRGPWLLELREDVINATLVDILITKGVNVEVTTASAARRGWTSIQTAAKAAAGIHE